MRTWSPRQSLSLGQYFEKRVGRADIRQCPYPLELPEKGSPRTFSETQIKRVRLIGSVQVRKGIDTFIKAAELVLRKEPDFMFEIWGADRNAHIFGKTLTEISQKQIPEDLKDKILFKGGIPYSQIPELFMDSCFLRVSLEVGKLGQCLPGGNVLRLRGSCLKRGGHE